MDDRCHAIIAPGRRCKLKIAKKNCTLCHKHLRISMDGTNVKIIDDYLFFEETYEEPVCEPDYEKPETQKPNFKVNYIKIDYSANMLPIKNNYFDNYYDTLTEQEIQKFEDVHQKMNNIRNKHKPQIKTKEILVPLDPALTYECQCCFTEYPFGELIKCSNASTKYKHTFCKDCIKGYVESGINDKKATCQCMLDTSDEHCNGIYTEPDIEKCLTEQTYAIFKDMLIVSEITSFAKMFDNYKICPFCNMFGVIVEGDIKYVECKRCTDKSWCIMCKKDAHGEDSCWKIKDEKDIESIIHMVTETITNALTRKCPKCFTEYVKEEGCNLIKCTACHSYSCYLCGILIEPRGGEKYWHFYGEGGDPTIEKTCKLFNDTREIKNHKDQGNNKFNNDKIITACKELLNANSLAVQTIMKTEMKKYGVDLETLHFQNKLIEKPLVVNSVPSKKNFLDICTIS